MQEESSKINKIKLEPDWTSSPEVGGQRQI